MDINFMRVAVTVTGLVVFLALVVWAWSRNRKADFDAAARLPFLDDAGSLPADAKTPNIKRTGGGQA